jgi:hypothetical protein
MRIVPIGRNNVPIVSNNPGYNNMHSQSATNQWSPEAIKVYKALIPMDYKLHDEHLHISIASTIDKEIEEQPRLNKCNPEEELLLWHLRFAQMPFKTLQNMSKVAHLPKRLSNVK